MHQTYGRLAGAIVLGAALLLSANASAGVDGRQDKQKDRIEAGVESGELTRREAHGLAHQQANIKRREHRFRNNDGHLGPVERAKLNRQQNRASRNIFRKKHNNRTR